MRYAHDRDEAQDILQEGFIKMFNNAHKYRGEGNLEGWIRRIMVHCAISRYRKQKPMVLVDDFTEDYDALSNGYNSHGLEAKDLLKMIQKLPQMYCSVFNLCYRRVFAPGDRLLGITELFIAHQPLPGTCYIERHGEQTYRQRGLLHGRVTKQ